MSIEKKVQTTVPLIGMTGQYVPAKAHQASQVLSFVDSYDANIKFQVSMMPNGKARLVTGKGTYFLDPHATIENLWTGTAKGIKVHFTKKKIVAKLIYWA